MTYHRVLIGDQLPDLAARYLGDASRWRDIAEANQLRSPYISDDPHAAAGAPLATLTTDSVVAIGQRVVPLPGGDPSLIRPRTRVWIWWRGVDGLRRELITTTEAYDGQSLTISAAPDQLIPLGATVVISPTAGELRGRVAQPGEIIRIPTATTATESDDRFGRDISCQEGRLVATPSGDLALVGDSANLAQQLRHRLQTPRGSLIRHPTYGCTMHAYVGQAARGTLGVLVQAAVVQAIGDDPRITRIEPTILRQAGEVTTVSVAVEAQTDMIRMEIAL